MNEFYEKMREQLDLQQQSRIKGLRSDEVVARNYSADELLQLVESLKRRPLLGDDTFRLSCFIFERQSQRIPEAMRHLAADNIASCVTAGAEDMDIAAVEIFAFWGSHRADYRPACLSFLHHARMEIRQTALRCAGQFLRPSEYSTLFIFQHDPYVSEIAMGGPLRYVLRDYALDILKQLTKCPVTESDCFEDTPDGRVSYRSWSPFLNWFEKHKRQFS